MRVGKEPARDRIVAEGHRDRGDRAVLIAGRCDVLGYGQPRSRVGLRRYIPGRGARLRRLHGPSHQGLSGAIFGTDPIRALLSGCSRAADSQVSARVRDPNAYRALRVSAAGLPPRRHQPRGWREIPQGAPATEGPSLPAAPLERDHRTGLEWVATASHHPTTQSATATWRGHLGCGLIFAFIVKREGRPMRRRPQRTFEAIETLLSDGAWHEPKTSATQQASPANGSENSVPRASSTLPKARSRWSAFAPKPRTSAASNQPGCRSLDTSPTWASLTSPLPLRSRLRQAWLRRGAIALPTRGRRRYQLNW